MKLQYLFSFFVLASLIVLGVTQTPPEKMESIEFASYMEREPSSHSMVFCQSKSDQQLAEDLLKFISHGGLLRVQESRCQEGIQASVFHQIEMIEMDIPKKSLILKDQDKIELRRVSELKDELGLEMNTFMVDYIIQTEGQALPGQLLFSRSKNQQDLDIYGCAYIRNLPDILFVKRRCIMN